MVVVFSGLLMSRNACAQAENPVPWDKLRKVMSFMSSLHFPLANRFHGISPDNIKELSNRVLTFDFPLQVGEAKGTLHNFIVENFIPHQQVIAKLLFIISYNFINFVHSDEKNS